MGAAGRREGAALAVSLLAAGLQLCAAADTIGYCDGSKNLSVRLDINDDCDFDSYTRDRTELGGFAMLVGVVVCCFCMYCMAGRLCCGCCGGNSSNPDSFCSGAKKGDEPDLQEQSEWYRSGKGCCKPLFVKLLVLVCVVLGIACIVSVNVGLADVLKGWNDLWDALWAGIAWFRQKVDNIDALVTNLDGTFIGGIDLSLIQDLRSAIDSSNKELQDIHDKMAEDASITISALVLGSLPVVMALLVLILAMLNCAGCMNCCTCAIIPLALLAWLMCGVGTILHLIMDDLCFEIQLIHKGDMRGFLGSYLLEPVCPQDDLKNATRQLNNAVGTNLWSACQGLRDICDEWPNYRPSAAPDLIWVCDHSILTPVSPMCMSDIDGLRAYIRTIPMKNDPRGALADRRCTASQRCSVADCATECAGDALRGTTSRVVKSLEDAHRSFRAYREELLPLSNCTTVWRKILAGWEEPTLPGFQVGCSDFVDGIGLWRAGTVLAGVCLTLLAIASTLGKKRFLPVPKVAPAEDQEMAVVSPVVVPEPEKASPQGADQPAGSTGDAAPPPQKDPAPPPVTGEV
eukprot:TRINITY_DN7365_c0_g1_i1.p1 TRINITY_DN7365_c0_g1~~TRINITY_DN7365_c0_g1_i1.p1  ORF type:complete len:608 (+),score=177.77 TRINITY_DN7365_c0_g1_i1:107-1825(+)